MVTVQRNPKDSMTSTWRKDKSKWTHQHHILNFLDSWGDAGSKAYPVFQKTDPIPFLEPIRVHIWIMYHALWPMALQYVYTWVVGRNLHPVAAILLYIVAFQANSAHQVNALERIARRTGFLDGDKHARDQVPDVGVGKVLNSVQLTTTIRPVFTIFLSYRATAPIALSWWLPVELALYSIVLDLFFYTYHRACHELDGLWKYHRTHHLTKHPVPLLSAYSDHEQEAIEIAIVPLLTYFTLKYVFHMPMGFYDWWVCHQFIIFAEAFGHSGLRLMGGVPGTSGPLLKLVGADLVVEDHDLHHRQGWKKSCNYGKQTRLWDRVFGTCGERIESKDANVDYVNQVYMPWY